MFMKMGRYRAPAKAVRQWLCGAVLLAPLLGGHAFAQSTRTWVSGGGDDSNPCLRTTPCLTLEGALAKTADGGLVTVLDAGSYGSGSLLNPSLTIRQSVTIEGAPQMVSAVGGIAGVDSIVIDAVAPVSVTLRNLALNGFSRGRHGIRVASPAQVVLDQMDIWGYTDNCLQLDAGASGAQVVVSRSSLSQCAVGVANAAAAAVELADETVVSLQRTASTQVTDPQGAVTSGQSAFVQGIDQQVVPQSGMQMSEITLINAGKSVGLAGGALGCAIASEQFLSPAAAPTQLPAGARSVAAAGVDFRTTQCGTGATVTVTLHYADPLPANTVLQKYIAGSQSWLVVPGAEISTDRMSISYQVTDNGPLDDDVTPGVIHDPAWPLSMAAGGGAGMVGIPATSPWGLALLTLLLAALVVRMPGRSRRS